MAESTRAATPSRGPAAATVVHWRGRSGRQWRLEPLRKLTAKVTLHASSTGSLLVTKSFTLTERTSSADFNALVEAELSFWSTAAKASARVLPLLDILTSPATSVPHALSPYIAPLPAPSPAPSLSLRDLVQALCALPGTSAIHGRLHRDAVLVDARSRLFLGGFGVSRAIATQRASPRDDVEAAMSLCAPLSGKGGAEFMARVKKGLGAQSVIELRYDIAALEGIVPACEMARPPPPVKESGKAQWMLAADLNSVNGVSAPRGHGVSEPQVLPQRRKKKPTVRNTSSGSSAEGNAGGNANDSENAPSSSVSESVPSEAEIAELDENFSKAVSGSEPDSSDSVAIHRLLSLVVAYPSLCERIFRLLFKRPIQKDPVIAYRALTLLHILSRDGPLRIQSLCVQHAAFFTWVETSWSAERIASRPVKASHPLAGAFSTGDISYYAAFIKTRAAYFRDAVEHFSHKWKPRLGRTEPYQFSRSRALRGALAVLESAAAVLRRAAAEQRDLMQVKLIAAQPLARDLALAYRACCWVYAGGDEREREGMVEELDAAHHATRAAFNVVCKNDILKNSLPAEFVLTLDENPPRTFDTSAMLAAQAAARKEARKNRKKARKGDGNVAVQQAAVGMEEERVDVANGHIEELDEKHDHSHAENGMAEGAEMRKERKKKKKKKRKERENRTGQKSDGEQANEQDERVPERERRQSLQNGHASPDTAPARKEAARPQSQLRHSSSSSSSSDDEDAVEPRRERKSKVKKEKSSKRDRTRKARRQRRRRSDSSTDSDLNDGESSSSSSSEDNGRSEKHGQKSKNSRRHLAERDIPFEKVPPKRKPTKEEAVIAEREGSKEALAAAAKGQKTPLMNSKFEVAPYEVQFGPQIGSGGFGVVHKAKFRGHTVAVKKIHQNMLSNLASIAEFQSEVAVLCTLRHPNILAFMGACTKPPNLMIITEFMARGTLFDVLHQSQTRITWPMLRKFALDTCLGMRYLHDSKLLHRDLKSSNLMLDAEWNCKVGDFGLTRISSGPAAVQMTGQCGTFQYMAVEVLANKPYSEKADVFSFGVLLWEMVARRLPYFGMQPMQVGIAVSQQGLRPTIPPKTPQPLAKLMRACWDSDPNKRPSFAQIVDILQAMPDGTNTTNNSTTTT